MQDYRRRHFDEDDRRDRYEGGRQRGEGQGSHGDLDDAKYAGHGDGWRGEDDRGARGGWRGDDDRWTGRASQRDYGQYGHAGFREGGQAGRGAPGGWGHEWGGYSGGRSGGDWSGGRSDWDSYGGRSGSVVPGPEGRSGGADWSSYRGRSGGDWGSGRSMGIGGTELGGYGQQSGSESGRGAWRPSGQSYAGRGPKDYRRSDDRIREDISDRLTDDDRIDASDISVQVQNCDVTLTGTVSDRDQKRWAEDVAERVSGVKEVTNNIRVSRGQQGDRPAGASGSRGKSSAV